MRLLTVLPLLLVIYLILGIGVILGIHHWNGQDGVVCIQMVGAYCPTGWGAYSYFLRGEMLSFRFWFEVLTWPVFLFSCLLSPDSCYKYLIYPFGLPMDIRDNYGSL